jgi:hypothetical protein
MTSVINGSLVGPIYSECADRTHTVNVCLHEDLTRTVNICLRADLTHTVNMSACRPDTYSKYQSVRRPDTYSERQSVCRPDTYSKYQSVCRPDTYTIPHHSSYPLYLFTRGAPCNCFKVHRNVLPPRMAHRNVGVDAQKTYVTSLFFWTRAISRQVSNSCVCLSVCLSILLSFLCHLVSKF